MLISLPSEHLRASRTQNLQAVEKPVFKRYGNTAGRQKVPFYAVVVQQQGQNCCLRVIVVQQQGKTCCLRGVVVQQRGKTCCLRVIVVQQQGKTCCLKGVVVQQQGKTCCLRVIVVQQRGQNRLANTRLPPKGNRPMQRLI